MQAEEKFFLANKQKRRLQQKFLHRVGKTFHVIAWKYRGKEKKKKLQ